MIEAFIPVTRENFNAKAYLLANKDVAAAGVDPHEHFETHGYKENRLQINPELIGIGEYRARKFNRFKDALLLPYGLNLVGFPALIGSEHFDLISYQSESANGELGFFRSEIVDNPTKNYLEIGCGFRELHHENCLYLEVYPSISADIIAGTDCTYPIKSGSMDGIGCFAVLEHTRKPWKVVDEIHRILKKDGKVFIDWPFLQPVHGYPSHYFNATREGLSSIFSDAGFRIDEAKTYHFQGPDYTIAWILGKFIRDLPSDKQARFMEMSLAELLGKGPSGDFWRSILDGLPDKTISEFAAGNCLIATKG
ncbi:MAG: methyltransferase domain-containing protein [Methylocella sp.]